jgi:hypothetical protein
VTETIETAATPSRPASRRRMPMVVTIAVLAIAVVAWWAWPTLTRDDRAGLLVISDGTLDTGRRPLELRAREEGRTVRWSELDPTWCDDPAPLVASVRAEDPDDVVVSAGAPVACLATLHDALDGHDAIAVVQPGGPSGEELAAAGFDVVDPAPLVGLPGTDTRRSCEWWEPCDADGQIAVREPSGALTTAGDERVARLLVAAL